MATPPKKLDPQAFGDNAHPAAPPLDPDNKQFSIVLKDGSQLTVYAFRLFTSFDQNLGLVVRALRGDETEIGVFYAPLGWNLIDPSKWVSV